jgi:hypothetical protein
MDGDAPDALTADQHVVAASGSQGARVESMNAVGNVPRRA